MKKNVDGVVVLEKGRCCCKGCCFFFCRKDGVGSRMGVGVMVKKDGDLVFFYKNVSRTCLCFVGIYRLFGV